MTDPRAAAREQLRIASTEFDSLFKEPLFSLRNNEYTLADHVVNIFLEEMRALLLELDKISSLVNSTKDHVLSMCEKIHTLVEYAPNLTRHGRAAHKRDAQRLMLQLQEQFAVLERILK